MGVKTINDRFVLLDEPPLVGGMAHVHKAVDVKTGATVAVKFVLSESLRDERIVRTAFMRELSALQLLEHPNVVKVVDFDPENQPPFMVLEWMTSDLNAVLSTPMSWEDFFRKYGQPILDALVYALTKFVTHRDLKPANVLLDSFGTPKVADFGIARLNLNRGSSGGLTLGQFGSKPYAPFDEAASPESRDPYSFAVLALRCTSGRSLSTHDDVETALAAFSGPEGIHGVLSKALSADPGGRYGSVVELQAALESIQPVDSAAPDCYVTIHSSAVGKLHKRVENRSEQELKLELQEEIEESLVLSFWFDSKIKRKLQDQFVGRTAGYTLHLTIDDQARDHLLVLNAWPDESHENLEHLDRGYRPSRVALGRPGAVVDGENCLAELIEAIRQHDLEHQDSRNERKKELLFREWASALHARREIERVRHPKLKYDNVRVDGRRVNFRVPVMPEGIDEDEPRVVRLGKRTVLQGFIEEHSGTGVTVWAEHMSTADIPLHGELEFDDKASRRALDLQRVAVDAFRYESVRNHPKAPRFDRARRDRFARKCAEARLGVSV